MTSVRERVDSRGSAQAGGEAEAGGLGMKVDASEKSIADSLRGSDRDHPENSVRAKKKEEDICLQSLLCLLNR